jgi:glycosyltransferase involved in cell wall biosynthesis
VPRRTGPHRKTPRPQFPNCCTTSHSNLPHAHAGGTNLKDQSKARTFSSDRTSAPDKIELSVVIPCLNEADTVAACVSKAQEVIRNAGVVAEVIVADNESADGSPDIAQRLGAKVISVPARGYGNALMGGIYSARGEFVIMADADGSYDFGEIPQFLEKLRAGCDLAQGCRLPGGGGRILPGAMPFLHRWGNPLLSLIARHWFHAPIHDVYCGMRGFRRSAYESLKQQCTGMEFATEMIVKASLFGLKVCEVPVTLHPDGRRQHNGHMRTFRDGWRTLRFFLIYSPRWLFLIPGGLLILLGLMGYGLALPGLRIGGVGFDVHTLLFASLSILCGYQAILFALFTKLFAIGEGLMPEDPRLSRLFEVVNLERGLIVSVIGFLLGLGLLLEALNQWRATGFGQLNYAVTMRWVIPGVLLTGLGFQTILSSFFVSILGMRRRIMNDLPERPSGWDIPDEGPRNVANTAFPAAR